MSRLEESRKAFKRLRKQASAAAHTPERISEASEEHAGEGLSYVGEMVYGGLDGVITTFAVVSGVAGANLGANVILIMGMANITADGFAMAMGAYLSAKSRREFYEREYEREMWEVENFPEGERQELRQIYAQRGYAGDDAEEMLNIETKNKQRWVEAMMVHELGLIPDSRSPAMIGLATFLSFAVAGFVPLLAFLLGLFVPISKSSAFAATVLLCGLTLFGLGAAKTIVTGLSALRSGIEMLLLGGLAGLVAYAVGHFMRGLTG